MINIQKILLEVAYEWDSLEHKDMDTPAGHAIALATEVAKRAVLAEREACAALAEACDDADSAARFIRARSNAESNSALAHPTRTPC